MKSWGRSVLISPWFTTRGIAGGRSWPAMRCTLNQRRLFTTAKSRRSWRDFARGRTGDATTPAGTITLERCWGGLACLATWCQWPGCCSQALRLCCSGFFATRTRAGLAGRMGLEFGLVGSQAAADFAKTGAVAQQGCGSGSDCLRLAGRWPEPASGRSG